MTMGQTTWRLLKFRPGLFLTTIFFRGIDDIAPFLAGVIMKGFFDALTGQAEAGVSLPGHLSRVLSLLSLATASPFLVRLLHGRAGGMLLKRFCGKIL